MSIRATRFARAALTALSGFSLCFLGQTAISTAESSEVQPSDVTWAWQGWNKKTRDFFHYASQGTYLTQSDWFVALEQPNSEALISDPAHLASFGFMIEPKSPANPLGLPVGFSVGRNPGTNMISTEKTVGLTCSLCHSGQITYRGKTIRYDGLGAIANVTTFADEFTSAIIETYTDPAKWDRFSHRVLGTGYNQASNQALRTAFATQVNSIEWTQNNIDESVMFPVDPGYGRNDAIASIGNVVFGRGLQEPSNYHPANANVSFPFLWNAWKFDWVQYDASVTQPMQRNVGEALGVGAITNYLTNGTPTPVESKFKSSVDIYHLAGIETSLQSLEPPRWPEQLFGKPNKGLALEGRSLFNTQCATCHAPTPIVNARNTKTKLAAYILPIAEINTDPLRTQNASEARFDPSKLLGVPNSPRIDLSTGLDLVTEGAKQYFYRQEHLTPRQQANLNGNRAPITDLQTLRYKARTLEGAWASAPYLHNGSVRNIYDLLGPVEQRSTQFWVGLSDYDPVLLGVGLKTNENGFMMDTSQAGNSNTGHEFRNGSGPGVIGRELTDHEKMAIIEYMKVITVYPPARQPPKRLDPSIWSNQ